jgi:ferrous iron transport protein A
MGQIPLAMLPSGAAAKVVKINGCDKVRLRLSELGLVRDCGVTVLQNAPHGPLIISVGGSRIAVGRGVALKVIVEEAAHGKANHA